MNHVKVSTIGTAKAGELYVGNTAQVIQDAINYVGSNGGGSIFIEKGVYTITSPISINYSSIEIYGEGYHSQLINNLSTSNTGVFQIIGTNASRITNLYFHDLFIGNTSDTRAGQIGIYMKYVGKEDTNNIVESMYFKSNNAIHIKLEECSDIFIRENDLIRSNNDAISCQNGTRIFISDNTMVDFYSCNIGGSQGKQNIVDGNVFHYFESGVYSSGSRYMSIIANAFSGAGAYCTYSYDAYFFNYYGNTYNSTYYTSMTISYETRYSSIIANTSLANYARGFDTGTMIACTFIGNNVQGSGRIAATQHNAMIMTSYASNNNVLGNRFDGITTGGSGNNVFYNTNREY